MPSHAGTELGPLLERTYRAVVPGMARLPPLERERERGERGGEGEREREYLRWKCLPRKLQ